MKNNNVLWVVVLLAIGIGGWYLWSNSQAKIVTPESTGAVVPTVVPKTIVLEQTGVSGQSGTAVFQGDGKNTKVTLTMIGKKFTAPQPAHIHVGKCPNPGVVKYPLNNVVDGKSETTISVDIKDLFADLPLAVNIHESVEKASVYTACGDLK